MESRWGNELSLESQSKFLAKKFYFYSRTIHKVGGKGGKHEITGWKEPLPFYTFQDFPPLTLVKQHEEGATGCTQCCSPGTDRTGSDCSQQPNTHPWHLIPLPMPTVFSGNFPSATSAGSLWQHQTLMRVQWVRLEESKRKWCTGTPIASRSALTHHSWRSPKDGVLKDKSLLPESRYSCRNTFLCERKEFHILA